MWEDIQLYSNQGNNNFNQKNHFSPQIFIKNGMLS